MLLIANLLLALVVGVSAAPPTFPAQCRCIEDYNEALNLTESGGVWRLVASATLGDRDRQKDHDVHYAWLDFSFGEDRANFTHVIGFDGNIKSEKRKDLRVSESNGITSITSEDNHYNLTVYRMSNDSILVTERIKYYKYGDVTIQLYARATQLPDTHLDEFRRLADCMKYTDINVRPNQLDYASICPQNPLMSIYPLNPSQIAGSWTLVAKAAKSTTVTAPLGKNHTHSIKFAVDGEKVTYKEVGDGRTEEFHTDQENIWISKTEIQIQKDWDIVTMRFYSTCGSYLLMTTTVMPLDASHSILWFYTRSGKVTSSDLERFKLQAQCESLTNISVAPRAVKKGL